MASDIFAALASALGGGLSTYAQADASRRQARYDQSRETQQDEEEKRRREAQERRDALMLSMQGIRDTKALGAAPAERIALPEDDAERGRFDRLRASTIAPRALQVTARDEAGNTITSAPRPTTDAESLRDVHTTDRWRDVGDGFQQDIQTDRAFQRAQGAADSRSAIQRDRAARDEERGLVQGDAATDANALADAAHAAGAKANEVDAIRKGGRTAQALYSSVMGRIQTDKAAARAAAERGSDIQMVGGRPYRMVNGQLQAVTTAGADGKPETTAAGPRAKPETINAFTGRYQSSLGLRNATDIANSLTNMQVAYDAPRDGVSDYAMVVSLAKMLDPGSVVREGEVDVIRSAAGLPKLVVSAWNVVKRATGGTPRMLPDDVRDRVYQTGVAKAVSASKAFDREYKSYMARANALGIDPQEGKELLYNPFTGTLADPEALAKQESEQAGQGAAAAKGLHDYLNGWKR